MRISHALCLTFLVGCTGGSVKVDEPALPASEWVETPSGLRSRLCVQEVEDQAVVSPDPLSDCATQSPPQNNGWMISRDYVSPVAFGRMDTQFIVPPEPPNRPDTNYQLVYLFPAYKDNPRGNILQPVLQWGYDSKQWQFAAWVGINYSFAYMRFNVSVGDSLTGEMFPQPGTCNATDCAWSIRIVNNTTGQTKMMTVPQVPHLYDSALALEVYHLNTCDQYPAGGGLTFSSIAMQTLAGAPVTPVWSEQRYTTYWDAECQYDSSSPNPQTVTLNWSNTPSTLKSLGAPCTRATECRPGSDGQQYCDFTNHCGDVAGAKFIFASSQKYAGDLDGLAGADAKCQALADAASARVPKATYKAWLSTSSVDATARLGRNYQYNLPTNYPIAFGFDDLTDGMLANAISVDERGVAIPASDQVWTGTTFAGTFAQDDCDDWSDGTSASLGTYGLAGQLGALWSNLGTAECGSARRLYCVEQCVPLPGGGSNDDCFATAPLDAQTTLPAGTMLISFDGATPGRTYTVQATNDFVTWSAIATRSADVSGHFSFADSDAPSHSSRFYRAAGLAASGPFPLGAGTKRLTFANASPASMYQVQASDDGTTFSPLGLVVAEPNGAFEFVDATANAHPTRSYRARAIGL